MRVSLINSNALNIPLVDNSVHCVVTSPPYYGLRDYSIPGQLGLEPTLQEYIDNTIKWCAEVWRVLRDDGTFWLNLGDSYSGSQKGAGGTGKRSSKQNTNKGANFVMGKPALEIDSGLKPKDLMLVPHRVAIALQDAGWWVRSDIVWHKPNPMPESVTDRPTKSHEYIFLLTKNKKYYYDADAIREDNKWEHVGEKRYPDGSSKNKGTVDHPVNGKGNTTGSFRQFNPAGRNKRTVWTITTKSYSGAHFATFPPEIPEICIKAGSSEKGVCPVCGNQWERVVEKPKPPKDVFTKTRKPKDGYVGGFNNDGEWVGGGQKLQNWLNANPSQTTGWRPTCSHDEEPIPATVLDPFGGSGTTAMVANQLGRHGISLDLSWEYLQLAKKRTGITALKEWESGRKAEANLEGLPMFEDTL